MQLPHNFLPRATQVLLPRLSTPDEREAWLAQAFFLNEPRLYHDLRQLTGAPIVYVTRCITALLTAKCVPGREVHSLALLLNAVRIGSAPAEQREIDDLVTMLDPMCGPDSGPDTEEPQHPPKLPDGTGTRPAVPLQSIDTPLEKRTPTVFISYSHRDDDFAAKLIADLQNAGHAIWIDTVSIKGGDAWVRSIADGIRNSYAFLTIVSPDANASRWVLREYLLAENLRKPIYPVLAKQADIPFQMIDRQLIDMHVDYAAGLADLLAVLPMPSIPLPPMDGVLMPPPATQPSAPPIERSEPAPEAPRELPSRTASGSSSSSILDSIGDVIGDLVDKVTGRKRNAESEGERTKSAELPGEIDEPILPPFLPPKPTVVAPSFEIDDELEEAEAAAQEMPAPNRRALELQYIQRQWAEAFSAKQDAPSDSDEDMQVRWMALPDDATLDADMSGAESGHVGQVGAGLMSMRRAIVMGDSAREVAESVWSALDVLMQSALNDPTKPLPIIIDLAKWTDETQPLDAFVQTQLGELSDYWRSLLDQRRAALLFTGFDGASAPQRAARASAVEAFLRQHPELLVLVALQQ